MTTQPSPEQVERSELAEKWGTFLLANMLWAIVCIPVITIPAATAGLFAFMSKWARGKQVELFGEFFRGMRRYWWKSTLLGLTDLLLGGLIIVNLMIFQQMNPSDPMLVVTRSVTVFVMVALLLANLYAWPLLVTLNPSFRGLIENSVRLTFSYPLWSLGILAATLLTIGFSLLLPRGIFAIATASVCVLIINLGTWRVIRRHLPQEVLASL